MKTITLALFALSLTAAPIKPDMLHDGIALDPSNPAIGAYVQAIPGSSWEVFANDNWRGAEGADFDFNDIYISLWFASEPVADHLGAMAQWNGGISLSTNHLILGGEMIGRSNRFALLWFPIGGTVDIQLHTTWPGGGPLLFPSGSTGPDGDPHIAVYGAGLPVDQVPEPATAGLALIGVALLVALGVWGATSCRLTACTWW